jgi:hypothetical protein
MKTYQNSTKTVLRRRFIAGNAYIKKVNNLTFHLKKLEEKYKLNLRSRRKK